MCIYRLIFVDQSHLTKAFKKLHKFGFLVFFTYLYINKMVAIQGILIDVFLIYEVTQQNYWTNSHIFFKIVWI